MNDMMTWKDKYHRLRSEKDDLSKNFNNQEDKLRLLRTKYSKLENIYHKQQRNTNNDCREKRNQYQMKCVTCALKDDEYQNYKIDYLDMQKKYEFMMMKQKSGAKIIAKLKLENKKLRCSREHSGSSSKIRILTSAANDDDEELNENVVDVLDNEEAYDDLIEKLKHRVQEAESHLDWIREENDELRLQIKSNLDSRYGKEEVCL